MAGMSFIVFEIKAFNSPLESTGSEGTAEEE
jgi:hypothetical protein